MARPGASSRIATASDDMAVDAERTVARDVGPHPVRRVTVLDPQEPGPGEAAVAADATPPSRGTTRSRPRRSAPPRAGRSRPGRAPTSGPWHRRRWCSAPRPSPGHRARPGGRRGWRPGRPPPMTTTSAVSVMHALLLVRPPRPVSGRPMVTGRPASRRRGRRGWQGHSRTLPAARASPSGGPGSSAGRSPSRRGGTWRARRRSRSGVSRHP